PTRTARPILVALVITLVGTGLRLWHLADKPLWLDEVIAALFVLGRSLADVPVNQALPLSQLDVLFTYQPGLSCQQIAQTVATQSVHPPLFFCLLYRWMGLLPLGADGSAHWVWVLRALPALLGSLMIPLSYWLGCRLLSSRVGLATAALVAVSPFAVYLSQEARHYTLPMVLITLTLLLLLHLQQAIPGGKPRQRWGLLAAWAGLSLLGLYVHYFMLLTVVAQAGAFGLWLWRSQRKAFQAYWGELLLTGLVVVLGYLPWLPTLLSHLSRPETDWLTPYNPDWQDRLAPLYQLPGNWILSVVALPIEAQPLAIALPSALVMLAVGLSVGWWGLRGLLTLRHSPTVRLLAGFVLGVLLQFLAIVYFLDKDITAIPRYSFVYYPGLVALIAAGLCAAQETPGQRQWAPWARPLLTPLGLALTASALSSLLVVQGSVFQKGYYPSRVAQDIAFEPGAPVLLAVSHQSLQEVALGLSFAHELQPRVDQGAIAFMYRERGYGQLWRQFPQLTPNLPLPLNLWVVASPGMKTKDYPERLRLHIAAGRRGRCEIVPERFNRIGFPYQLFRCRPVGKSDRGD
ncbi:MAG: glycosyltransferase family 39 protein, partial [Cyanobacteria bacterium P01_A01_bin.135]